MHPEPIDAQAALGLVHDALTGFGAAVVATSPDAPTDLRVIGGRLVVDTAASPPRTAVYRFRDDDPADGRAWAVVVTASLSPRAGEPGLFDVSPIRAVGFRAARAAVEAAPTPGERAEHRPSRRLHVAPAGGDPLAATA